MEDFHVMERFKASYNLNEYFPDIVLLNVLLILLMSSYLLEEISIIRIFHHDAIRTRSVLEQKLKCTYHKLLLASSMNASL